MKRREFLKALGVVVAGGPTALIKAQSIEATKTTVEFTSGSVTRTLPNLSFICHYYFLDEDNKVHHKTEIRSVDEVISKWR